MTKQHHTPMRARALRRTALLCAGIPLAMVGLAYASVPLYDLFCRVTGFGGTPMVRTEQAGTVLDRTMSVRFDANVSPRLGWRFSPEMPRLETRIGQTQTVFYRMRNEGSAPSAGIATFNVTPELAAAYFVKLECFCFNELALAAGEEIDTAVVFYIDPAIVDDPNLKDIGAVTLSYTFHPARNGAPVATSALTPADSKM